MTHSNTTILLWDKASVGELRREKKIAGGWANKVEDHLGEEKQKQYTAADRNFKQISLNFKQLILVKNDSI